MILKGDNSIGEFYSVALTNNRQQADTGTKMLHLGKNTKSRIVSKGISAGKSQNSYRGLVEVSKRADNARTVAEILTKTAELKDKPVVVSGKVVKYNPGIMGKNWIHDAYQQSKKLFNQKKYYYYMLLVLVSILLVYY